ncbi:MAG: hypothetical protein IJW16_02615 [Clostridia bacterium]|nr:hypothetical protein [Clostridia bacterium]
MIKTLVKLRFTAFLQLLTNRNSKKGYQASSAGASKGKLILWLLLYAYVAVVFAFMFGSALLAFSSLAFAMNMEWFFFSMFVLMAFILMFIGSVFTTKSQLFEAKDNDILLTLPIRPRDILISRMVSLIIINFFFEMIVAIPAAVIWGIYGNGGILSWVFFAITVLALPFFSFAISGVFAWLLSLLSAKFKNSAWITTALYLVFFMGYFYVISNMQEYMQMAALSGAQIADAFRSVLPLYWFGSAIGNENALHLLLSLLIYIIPFVVAFAVIAHSFMKICTVKPSTGRAKKERAGQLGVKTHSVPTALLLRELKRLASSSTYMLNCGLGALLAIVASVAMVFNRDAISSLATMLGDSTLLGVILILMLCTINATCIFTAPSVSLEAKQIGLLRSLPVRTEEILHAKLKMHYVIMMPTEAICSLVLAIVFPLPLPMIIGLLIVPQLFVVWTANIGLICSVCHPMLEWTNEAVAVKQGTAVLLTMLFASLPAIVIGIGSIFLAMLSPWLALAAMVVLPLVGDILSYRYLMRGGVKRFEQIEV